MKIIELIYNVYFKCKKLMRKNCTLLSERSYKIIVVGASIITSSICFAHPSAQFEEKRQTTREFKRSY